MHMQLETFDLSESDLVEDIFWVRPFVPNTLARLDRLRADSSRPSFSISSFLLQAKFSSLYLPRFIESYLSLPGDGLTPGFLDQTSWITACVGRPYFHHLIRIKSDLPMRLLAHVVEMISNAEARQIAVRR